MKIKSIKRGGVWTRADRITYKMDREIILIEDAHRHEDGNIYAKITFAPTEEDDICNADTYNKPFFMVVKFDTKLEGDTWSKND